MSGAEAVGFFGMRWDKIGRKTALYNLQMFE